MSDQYEYRLEVPPTAIDGNGHVNNVEYLRWMQEAAISHADSVGCTAATLSVGASWVVRSHHVEYLRPTYTGEKLVIFTWISTLHKASSVRNYQIVRETDGVLLARGETNWVFVDSIRGRPKSIPPAVVACFTLDSADEPPSETTPSPSSKPPPPAI